INPARLPPSLRAETRWHGGFHFPAAVKFAFAVSFATAWIGVAIWLSVPWLSDLREDVGWAGAIVIVTLLAYVPGFIVAFLGSSLFFDREPPFRVLDPTTAVT